MYARDRFVAFVDILGFSALIEDVEKLGHGDFSRPLELTQALGSESDSEKFKHHGPTTCPNSKYLSQDLHFQVTQISDCVVISCEASPAGVINLISHCFGISIKMLHMGAMCRGVITRGNIYHQDRQFMGTGYMRAYQGEKCVAFLRKDESETGTPYIQIDESVSEYIRKETDSCVRQMFERMTDSDGVYTAIYPYKQLAKLPSTLVGVDFDPSEWKANIQRSIQFRLQNLEIFETLEREVSSENVTKKIQHCKRGLESVLEVLRKKEVILDTIISTGKIPYGLVI